MKEIIVEQKHNGKKLNTILLNMFNGLTLNTFYKALRQKDIRINDAKITENVIVYTGDNIKLYVSDQLLFRKPHTIQVIYEDNNILIVNKPSGIEVTGENSLTSILQKNSFIAPCHRLDRNTMGLTLFAKNELALSILLKKFQFHEIEKHYHVMVVGTPIKKQANLTAYLFKDSKKSLVYISNFPKKGYSQISTSYNLISFNSKQNTSILDVTLHTGKTHQIRAHLAHIGLPIVGDGKYGNNEINRKLGYKTQQLYSYSLKFNFNTDSNILNYLNGKLISLSKTKLILL